MKRWMILSICIMTLLSSATVASAQGCGPFCPVCSGSGRSTGALVSPAAIIPSFLYVPNGEEETGVINVRGGITPWLDVGVGYTIKAEKPIWSLRLQLLKEAESNWRPTVIIGTGSVQTGGSDQSVFIQLAKSWEFSEIFSLRVFTGAASLLPDVDRGYGLAGLTCTITDRWSPFVSYDGINYHPGISWIPTDWMTISTVIVESKEPALAVAFRLSFISDN